MTSTELFAAMSPALAADVIEFNHAEEKAVYRAALEAIAQSRKVRPVFLERQPRTERLATLVASLSRPQLGLAADTLLRCWLLRKHTALLTDFLNALGIPHENGAVESLPKTVDDAALKAAIEGLLAKHPAEVVAIYLRCFNSMNVENWANLDRLLQEEPRLALGAAAA
ncbi:MAG: hypothetical protein RJA22_1799 [Verrucomicrobiota bacterium]|jgi:hypothetical protein